jgi:hypothetical protein
MDMEFSSYLIKWDKFCATGIALTVFLKPNQRINYIGQTSGILSKKRRFFPPMFFGRNYFCNHNVGPGRPPPDEHHPDDRFRAVRLQGELRRIAGH